VFLSELASNALKLLSTGKGKPNLSSLLTVEEVAHLALSRWIVPRSERQPDYLSWRREDISSLLGERRSKQLSELKVKSIA